MKKIDKSVGNKAVCYGCGMCATVCPTGVIAIMRNRNGFYVPRIINSEVCTGCGLCSKVCNYGTTDSPLSGSPIECFAAWSNDDSIRKVCSSGGIAYEIARHYIDLGYKICAVQYNPHEQKAEHYVASTKEELLQSAGSKYLQSYTIDGFSEIDLNQKYVIIGTPCQIDMWRRFLRLRNKEENFVLIDFFCHGVPSYRVWDKYLHENAAEIADESMMTWRDKASGWHSSWNISAYHNEYFWSTKPYYRSSSKCGDGFYFMFLGNGALNPACYSDCKYKKYNSSADIRLGDLWGGEFASNEKGVSGVLTFTEKGKGIIEQLNITKTSLSPEKVTDGQIAEPLSHPWYYGLSKLVLRTNIMSIKRLRKIVVISEIIKYQGKKLKNIMKWERP